ncbi:hypothetical protein GCK72_004058 [Caenorhabditis remanei]|uniref:TOG domain-containing protein n=1 Tax=Caenorhabditis remanei TaxID=31234 RepID=A0A6A5HCK3_CAERE|nr:hypothetical protein GCK72_004058 [Caenorhabditis remanei]KAF1764112.1 hypothetical protein GCK72_004058 [Caenorhabditis remanei]
MDEWSILDEVDVIAKWPTEHKKAVLEAGAKWKERKEGLEALNTIIESNPRLATSSMTIYGELMDEIRKILDRESNIVVVTTAIKTVELLARGLRQKFGGFVGMVIPFLIKRAKDKKKNVRDAILSALSSVSDTTSSERLLKDIIDWFSIPSPESKQTLLSFLFSYWCRQFQMDIPFVKAVAPLVVKASTDSDVTVRDKACQALGALKRLMGDAISAFLVPISTDTSKMEKIQQYLEEATEEFKKFQESQPKSVGNSEKTEEEGGGASLSEETESAATSSVMDPWEIMDSEDVGKKIEKGVEGQLVDKNWKERVAGGESIKKSMDGIGRIEISERLHELLKILIKIIEKDVNVNVAALSAQILKETAQKSRFAFASLAHRAFPVVFDKLKDKKAVLRDALVEFCDEAAVTTPLSAYSEAVITALGSKNPQIRQQTALFLSRFYAKNDTKTVEIDVVKQLVEHILKATNDADKEVREASLRIVASIQKSLGEAVAKRLLADVYDDKLKAEKIPSIIEELEKEYGSTAAPEILRLAKHYKIGGTAPPKPSAPPTKRATSAAAAPPPRISSSAKPSGTVRPVQSAATRRAPSPKAPPPTATVPPMKPKPFVARPAPNFGGGGATVGLTAKPKATVAPARVAPKVAPSSRPTTSSRPMAPVRPTPIAPNVVRHTVPVAPGAPMARKPVGIARPQTAGAPSTGGPTRSRIATPSGIARPGSSALPRPPSNSRIARPPSRPSSRNE